MQQRLSSAELREVELVTTVSEGMNVCQPGRSENVLSTNEAEEARLRTRSGDADGRFAPISGSAMAERRWRMHGAIVERERGRQSSTLALAMGSLHQAELLDPILQLVYGGK